MEAPTQETSGTETAFIGKNVPFRTRVLSFTRRFMHTNICVAQKMFRRTERAPTPAHTNETTEEMALWRPRNMERAIQLINMAMHVAISVTNSL